MDPETAAIIAELNHARPAEFYGSMLIAWNNRQYWIAYISARALIACFREQGRPHWCTEGRLATIVTIGRTALRKLGRDPKELLA